MGLPAQELYFSDNLEYSPQTPNKEYKTANTITFVKAEPEPQVKDKIKIIGIGGEGRNALNHIISSGIKNVDFLAVDTDVRNLELSQSQNKIILGKSGTGAGCIPANGEEAAHDSLSEVMKFMTGADMIYLTAGMGGGTGTGVIPVIANAARNLGILTVAIVTKPFVFEGSRKLRLAKEGIAKLRESVDALIVIPNQKLLEICDKDAGIPEAFAMADEVLLQAVVSVTDLITTAGTINLDFADVKAVMQQSGVAVMGIGKAKGINRIEEALKQAMESPLMETTPYNAKGALLNITSNGDLTLYELNQAAGAIYDVISPDATFVWGSSEDSSLDGEVRLTIIATGLEETAEVKKVQQPVADVVNKDEINGPASERVIKVRPNFVSQPAVVEESAEVKPQFLDITQKYETKQAATTEKEAFLPAWLRSQPQQETKVETEPPKPELKIENPVEDIFSTREAFFDEPSYIRRKKTAPTID